MMKRILLFFFLTLNFFLVSCTTFFTPKITFYVGNHDYETISSNGEETLELPDDPVKSGYEFQGWYFDDGIWNLPFDESTYRSIPLEEDVSVYAYFERVYNQSEIYSLLKESVFKVEILDKNQMVVSQGSGFFVKQDGTFMTNAHVVDDAWYGRIDQDGVFYDVDISSLLKFDSLNDYAILKIKNLYGVKYKPVTFSTDYEIGDTVYSIGYPKNSFYSYISSGRIKEIRTVSNKSYIVTDAKIEHGSSGGITVDRKGKVIGMTSVGFADGLYGSIPIDVFDQYIDKTYLSPESLIDFFHPSKEIILSAYNIETYFDIYVTRTGVSFSSDSSGWVYYSISVIPKDDYELVSFDISINIWIRTEYTYRAVIGSRYYYYDSSSSSWDTIHLYQSTNLTGTSSTYDFIATGLNYLSSINSYSYNVSSAIGRIKIYT